MNPTSITTITASGVRTTTRPVTTAIEAIPVIHITATADYTGALTTIDLEHTEVTTTDRCNCMYEIQIGFN